MAAQQGFQYEINAANFLKPMGVVPKAFRPAGAGHDQPDLIIQSEGVESGCELKITDASAGSLVLKWDPSNKRTPWSFGDISKDDTEKVFIRDLAIRSGAVDAINRSWKKAPAKFSPIAKTMTKEESYKYDLNTFKDIKGDIPAKEIEDYYNKKDTYYVNVGTHGFYLFGRKDNLKLNSKATKHSMDKVPLFGSSAKAWYRARVQYKGGGNYQFTFEMQFKILTKSPYNIAPIMKGSVTIDKRAAALHILL